MEFVDIDASPGEARRYGVTRAGTVVVESGTRFRKIETVTEPALVTAILQVTSAAEPLVCFATGEGEHGLSDTGSQGLSGLASVLTASNYQVAPSACCRARCPPIVRPSSSPGARRASPPTRSSASTRTSRAAAGSLLLLDPPVDPGVAILPGAVRHHGGAGRRDRNERRGRAVGAGPENPLAFVYHDHPITRGFEQRTIYDRAVPLGIAPTEVGEPRPLASTGDTAFERVDLASQAIEFRDGRDRRGPFVLAVATSIPRGSATRPSRNPASSSPATRTSSRTRSSPGQRTATWQSA